MAFEQSYHAVGNPANFSAGAIIVVGDDPVLVTQVRQFNGGPFQHRIEIADEAGQYGVAGAGADKIKYSLGAGVLDVVNFGVAHDLLSINLNGGSLLQTIVGGSDWISSASDLSHGVLLAGVGSAQKVTISGGVATVG